MLNRNSSAGTAAKKCSKCSLLQRPPIILAMLLLCAVYSVNAQQKFSLSKSMLPKDTLCNACKFFPLIISDSLRNVAWISTDSILTVIDSAATIKVLVGSLFRQMEVNEKLYAAMGVLGYITNQGKITDIGSFKLAVKKYHAVSAK